MPKDEFVGWIDETLFDEGLKDPYGSPVFRTKKGLLTVFEEMMDNLEAGERGAYDDELLTVCKPVKVLITMIE